MPPADQKRPLLSLKELLKPHIKSLTLGMMAVLGGGVADLLEPWPLKVVLDFVIGSKKPQGWTARIIDNLPFIAAGDKYAVIEFAAFAVVAIAIVGALCSYAQKYLTTSVGQWVMHDLRAMLYSHIQRLSLSFHDETRTGDLISRVTTDIDAIQSFIASGLLDSLSSVLTLVGMVGVMLYINWRFTLIALAVSPVLFVVVFVYTRKIKQAAREVRKKEGAVVSVIEEVFSSIRVVKAFAREDYESKRLETESMDSLETALRARSLKARLAPMVDVIVAVGTALVLWFGARLVLRGTLLPGSLVMFIMYLGKMYKPMQELSKMTDAYSKAEVGYERIREVFETENKVKDLPGARRAPRFKGQITFDKVSFSYEKDRQILRDVSFQVNPGQVLAIVGPTGAGKTTLIGMIPRFYDPTSGVVRVDGEDIKRYTQESIRQQMSFVLQETLLFNAPVWQNIAYGRPQASRDDILRAADIALAKEFIDKMPQGYDTMIGERGVTLSGGQRQRIAIARAVIRGTPILVLDEPSSGLDAESERLVFSALDRLMEGKTSVVIAHRLSTIQRADLIIVVKDGSIIESGKHADLLQAGGLYSEFYALQVKDTPVKDGSVPQSEPSQPS